MSGPVSMVCHNPRSEQVREMCTLQSSCWGGAMNILLGEKGGGVGVGEEVI